jgi:hypothetical protein
MRLVVFAQLSGGIGDVSFFVEVRRGLNDELVRTTVERTVTFVDRVSPINLAVAIEGVTFAEPGVYVVSLFCQNTWVCDTVLRTQ